MWPDVMRCDPAKITRRDDANILDYVLLSFVVRYPKP